LYFDSLKAAGGLPVGSNAPMLALLSGGIDSPVACHMTMKRGCHVDFLTFHSYPYTPRGTVEKVQRIADLVNQFQTPRGILYACNISEIQKLIRDNCDPRYRTVLYRRIMMRIASKLCTEKKRFAIVTGESIGQVASQTVENMSVIEKASDYLIVRPLCGFDKNETIRRAEAIGSFETSIEPMPDSCTVFAPDSPVLRAKLHTVEYEESKIPDLENAIQQAYDTMEIY
jgi:thiamine biosynthesis protein ThiI